jgi:hypothetical protein
MAFVGAGGYGGTLTAGFDAPGPRTNCRITRMNPHDANKPVTIRLIRTIRVIRQFKQYVAPPLESVKAKRVIRTHEDTL